MEVIGMRILPKPKLGKIVELTALVAVVFAYAWDAWPCRGLSRCPSAAELVVAAKEQIGVILKYDCMYREISYPNSAVVSRRKIACGHGISEMYID